MLRTVNDQPTLWDAILPAELLVLATELARVDVLLDDPVFFAPFAGGFDARIGRPSIPMKSLNRAIERSASRNHDRGKADGIEL